MDETAIREIKREVEEDLLRRPGVTGVDVGYKVVGGEKTDQLAIRIYVENKGQFDPGDAIPPSIHGVPTDVLQRRIRLHNTSTEAD